VLKKLVKKKQIASLIDEFVFSTGSTVCIYDYHGNLLAGVESSELPCKYPVNVDGRPVGWICGHEKAATVADLFSQLAYLEYEKKALGREVLDKYREITFLYNITEKFAGNLEPKDVAQLLVDEAQKLFKADNISIMISHEDEGLIEVMAVSGKEFALDSMPGKGIVESVYRSGKPEIVNDVLSDERSCAGSFKESSLMCAPLKIKSRVLGVINVSTEDPTNYTAGDLKLLSAVAVQAASAIENAILYSKLKETFLNLKQKKEELDKSISMRIEFGYIFIAIVLMISLYTFMLNVLIGIQFNNTAIYIISRLMEVSFVFVTIGIVLRSKLPWSSFGLTLQGAKQSITESLLISGFLMIVLAWVKYTLARQWGLFPGESLISFKYLDISYYTYVLVAPLQELISRGILQGAIQRFLLGRFSWIWAVVVTSFMFGVFHIHESIGLGIVSILGGILWGGMYARHKTLIGVSISHFLLGNWLGLLGFWDWICP